MPVSLHQLENDWLNYKPAGQRPMGGRRALMGFDYQISLSLNKFFDKVLKNDEKALVAFEGLSDVSEMQNGILYLTQVKATLTPDRFKDSLYEFLAVDRFLEDMHQEIRFKVRYQIACKATKGTIRQERSADELGLTPEDAARWATIRPQLLPYVVQGDPSLELAIKLWNRVSKPFDFIYAARGVVLQSLAANDSSDAIGEKLLKRWQDEQTTEPPPGELLTPSVFRDQSEGQTHILVGQRPSIEDLNAGCFMEREALVNGVLEALDSTASYDPMGTANRTLPVLWISGGSGVGKSALLLQAIRKIVIERETPVNYLRHFADQLPESLTYWGKQNIASVIAIDDLYAPSYRDAALWSNVSRAAYEAPYATVITCGPDDYREAFEQNALAQGTISVVPIEIPVLSDLERGSYREWYGIRTHQEEIKPIKETNFVVAAFLLERRRRGDADIGEFVARLQTRLATYGLVNEFLIALAVNRLGIEAPIKLFQGKRDAITQLVKEGLVQLVETPDDEAYVQWFHQALARKIYDILTPPESVETRAIHLAQYFSSISEDPNQITSLLQLLGNAKQKRLPEELVKETLKKIGEVLKEANPPELNIGYLFLWRDAASNTGLIVEKILPPAVIRKWMTSPGTDAEGWGMLWQILWDYELPSERKRLTDEALVWLESHMYLPQWNFVWQRLWAADPQDERFKELVKEWLNEHTDARGWSYAFQKVYDAGIREHWLLINGLDGLLNSPVTRADKYIWTKIESLEPDPTIFLQTVTRRACSSSIPYFRTAVDEYIVSRLPLTGIEPLIAELDQDHNKDGSGWWSVLRNLLDYSKTSSTLDGEERLTSIARKWLIGREDNPLWHYVWRRLLRYFRDDQSFRELGQAWLAGREDRPGAGLVWRSLLEYLPRDESLVRQAREWLVGREGAVGWAVVWRSLLEHNPRDEFVLKQGQEWLVGREGQTDWPFVWECLLNHLRDRKSLLAQGREWLTGREDRPRWSHVWQSVLESSPGDESLLRQGQEWLAGREDNKGWGYVWNRLLDDLPGDESLLDNARGWLTGREDTPSWPFVWQRLLEYVEDDQLVEQGREWLVGRENRRKWNDVWQRVQKYFPGDESLLKQAQEWLAGREDNIGWSYVWRRLLDSNPGNESLLEIGQGWLAGHEDNKAWSYVWNRLLDYRPGNEFLLDKGRKWLTGRQDTSSWPFVWQRLIHFDVDESLMQQGREWLVGRENNLRWNNVWQSVQKYFPRDESLLKQGRDWLAGRENSKGWSYVWKRLLDCRPGDKSLLKIGREWMVGREQRPEYPFIKASLRR